MTFTNSAASAPATQFWRDRGPESWARVLPTYWEAGGQPHRKALLEALHTLPRFESLREIGCCAGTNLRLIRETYPWVLLEGTELSIEAATFAQDKFAADVKTRVVCTDLFADAPLWPDRDTDVTVSCYTLAYVAPEDLDDILRHMLRASAIATIIVEPMHNGPVGRLPVTYAPEWRHDYKEAINRIMAVDPRKADLSVGQISPPTESCDGILAVRFL